MKAIVVLILSIIGLSMVIMPVMFLSLVFPDKWIDAIITVLTK